MGHMELCLKLLLQIYPQTKKNPSKRNNKQTEKLFYPLNQHNPGLRKLQNGSW